MLCMKKNKVIVIIPMCYYLSNDFYYLLHRQLALEKRYLYIRLYGSDTYKNGLACVNANRTIFRFWPIYFNRFESDPLALSSAQEISVQFESHCRPNKVQSIQYVELYTKSGR